MRYFNDLTPDSDGLGPYSLPGVFNIGWINLDSDFTAGKAPSGFIKQLTKIILNRGDFNSIVEMRRAYPRCPVCGKIDIHNAAGKILLDSKLWIPHGDIIYSSPIAILHYIEHHHYLPPQEYIDAVLNWHSGIIFNGDKTHISKLRESGWLDESAENKMKYAREAVNRRSTGEMDGA